MKKEGTNFAYIDGANLYMGISSLGWTLDYARFRVWLSEKYGVSRAYLFMGLIPKYSALYSFLQEAGFTLIFKETTYSSDGKAKGNCDADLVLHVASGFYEKKFNQAIIVSGDGDFASLVKFLNEHRSLRTVLAIDEKKCSILLKRTGVPITYLKEFENQLSLKEKAPDADGTA
jgi:uncharacterized LabA/DUF88 family protein